MTRDIHDIEAVFAAFGMPTFPYRTFPMPADAQAGAALQDRRRDRPRADVRRPGGPGLRGPIRRAGEGHAPAIAQPVPPRP